MSDLIDRTALIADIDKLLPVDPLRDDYTQGRTTGLALAMERIKNAPSVLGTNLAEVGTDLISRQQAIDALKERYYKYGRFAKIEEFVWSIERLPPIQPDNCSEFPNNSDVISRQAAIDAVNGLIDRFEQILRDIREANGDDSVCGMCEYDGAYIGQSGDWCNECPGFDKEDCFKLSDKCRKRWLKSVQLPPIQPKRGKWISADAIFGGVPFYCSECGENTRDTVMGKPRWNFCPNCGADMREVTT